MNVFRKVSAMLHAAFISMRLCCKVFSASVVSSIRAPSLCNPPLEYLVFGCCLLSGGLGTRASLVKLATATYATNLMERITVANYDISDELEGDLVNASRYRLCNLQVLKRL